MQANNNLVITKIVCNIVSQARVWPGQKQLY